MERKLKEQKMETLIENHKQPTVKEVLVHKLSIPGPEIRK